MFDFSFSEIALFVIVAMIFIRPKDLPVAIRTISNGIKAMRRMASEFQSHVDDMVREADLSDARDEFRNLRNFNLRDRVGRFVDADGSLREGLSLDDKHDPSALPRVPPAPLPPPPPMPDAYESFGGGVPVEQPVVEHVLNEDVAQAPVIMPPSTARRLLRERSRWEAPHILPPVRTLHHGRRVPIRREETQA
nr:Sec-independent protein translocase protein TatB [uncultured Neokomagataea sp.]